MIQILQELKETVTQEEFDLSCKLTDQIQNLDDDAVKKQIKELEDNVIWPLAEELRRNQYFDRMKTTSAELEKAKQERRNLKFINSQKRDELMYALARIVFPVIQKAYYLVEQQIPKIQKLRNSEISEKNFRWHDLGSSEIYQGIYTVLTNREAVLQAIRILLKSKSLILNCKNISEIFEEVEKVEDQLNLLNFKNMESEKMTEQDWRDEQKLAEGYTEVPPAQLTTQQKDWILAGQQKEIEDKGIISQKAEIFKQHEEYMKRHEKQRKEDVLKLQSGKTIHPF